MQAARLTEWMNASPRRVAVARHLASPLTATQLAGRTSLSRSACSRALSDLSERQLASCLNPTARRNRIYGLTPLGRSLKIPREPDPAHDTPIATDWSLLGWASFRHRSAILRSLSHPMQPSEIKRRARRQDSSLRMSAGNVRDVVKLLLARGIVAQVRLRKRAHPMYELTDIGRQLRQALLNAEARA